MVISPQGRMLAGSGCQKGTLGPVEPEALRSREANLFGLLSLKLCLGRGPSFGQEVLVTL